MKIVHTRRIFQIFFFALFVWLCIVGTVGGKFWQISDWPVNFFLQLDPLVALGTIFSTHKLYYPLIWALVTVILTIIFGRFFCSWICPFGSVHHLVGFLAHCKKNTAQKIQLNKYRRAQCIKYYLLIFFLIMAALAPLKGTLQAGLLDPISLITRSFNLMLLPIADKAANLIWASDRFYEGAWFILAVFLTAVLLNIIIPRFYCRFICPLGALFGVIDRFTIWRIGKRNNECVNCRLCEKNCEGGCEPAGTIKISECVLCFNCLDDCKHEIIGYQTKLSAAGELTSPDISRRGFLASLASGVLAVPALGLSNNLGSNWYHKIIRPPGSLAEEEFLKRCIKCGQCMRICPTNVIQPGSFAGGLENLWTPVLNNRIGSSGCQLNCVSCSGVCPTGAIRPISLSEKLGTNEFKDAGPIKLGTAFVDKNRCLPWAFGRACIVCQENCPVSPKAIYTKEIYSTIRNGQFKVTNVSRETLEISDGHLEPEKFATGDYYCFIEGEKIGKIAENTEKIIKISKKLAEIPQIGSTINIRIRLQRPYVDAEKCIGCGVCEHECPVSGKRAIRVSAEGETRSLNKGLFLKG